MSDYLDRQIGLAANRLRSRTGYARTLWEEREGVHRTIIGGRKVDADYQKEMYKRAGDSGVKLTLSFV